MAGFVISGDEVCREAAKLFRQAGITPGDRRGVTETLQRQDLAGHPAGLRACSGPWPPH